MQKKLLQSRDCCGAVDTIKRIVVNRKHRVEERVKRRHAVMKCASCVRRAALTAAALHFNTRPFLSAAAAAAAATEDMFVRDRGPSYSARRPKSHLTNSTSRNKKNTKIKTKCA